MERKHLVFAILGVLTLGLAPFFPEPHLFGKVRWLMGGAEGMKFPDYFDLLMHGAPWAYLLIVLITLIIKKLKTR